MDPHEMVLRRTKTQKPEMRTFRDQRIQWKGDGIYEWAPDLEVWVRLWSIAFVELAGKYKREFVYVEMGDTITGDDTEILRKLMED